jgi:hypothetical protein
VRKRWQDPRNATKAALFAVVEATAILEGTAANLSWAAGQSRAWVWLNALAHRSWYQINQLAELPVLTSGSWQGAASFLASELRACAANGDGLVEVQRAGLIPLELDVLAGRRPAPDSPVELIATVQAEIDRVRRCGEERREEAR